MGEREIESLDCLADVVTEVMESENKVSEEEKTFLDKGKTSEIAFGEGIEEKICNGIWEWMGTR